MDRPSKVAERSRPGHRRSKSSTAVLKSIITGGSRNTASKEKENTTPPSTALSASIASPIATPIWEEFNKSSSRRPQGHTHAQSKIPLNDRTIEQEINLYTPRDHSFSKPKKERETNVAPALVRRDRPKSVLMERGKSAMSVFDSIVRPDKNESDDLSSHAGNSALTTKSGKVPLRTEGGAAIRTGNHTRSASRDLLTMAKRGTKVMGLVAAFNKSSGVMSAQPAIDPAEIEEAFEAVLESRNVPENMRKNLRLLKPAVKANLIKSNDVDFAAMAKARSVPGTARDKHVSRRHEAENTEKDSMWENEKKATKRSRPRSKTFTLSRSKKSRSEDSQGLAKSAILTGSSSSTALEGRASIDGGSSAVPDEFVKYLRDATVPQTTSVGKIHKLRQLLRNETVAWVEQFVEYGGLTAVVNQLHLIMQLEWREEHEDQLLHEILLCLKALCTTDNALRKLSEIEATLFPALLGMLFDKERKGPNEYTTRGIIISVLLAHLNGAINDLEMLPARARAILGYLSDQGTKETELPFIAGMRQSRPFKLWHQEVNGVSKEVFWIYLHHHNIVSLPTEGESTATKYPDLAMMEREFTAKEYATTYFPSPRPPVPAAPYVGGVEWEATNYIAVHLDLLNGLIAALPTKQERNELRAQLRSSYWEKTMGSTLRTCKEKFYSCIHDALRQWVAAAIADGWDVRDVRMGPKLDKSASPRKSPTKISDEKPPILDAPKLDLNLHFDDGGNAKEWI